MESSSTAPSPPLVTTTPVIYITIPVSTKLDRTNFLTWRSQIEPIVDGYGLARHLDSSIPIPASQIEVDGELIANPTFTSWHMQDRLLLGWLRSTISGSVLSQYISSQTAGSLWDALHRVYSAISSVRVMELRRLLQSTTRGGQGWNDYFEKMRSIADQLAAVGEPVSDSDLIRYVINGLGSEFNSFVVALTTRSDPVSLADLHGFLLTHEYLLVSQHQVPLPTPDPVAMYTVSDRGRGRHQRSRGRGSPSTTPPLLPTPPGHSRGDPGGPVRPSREATSNFSSYSKGRGGQAHQVVEDRPTCQICCERGHLALNCWYISEFELYPAEAPPQMQALVNTTASSPSEGWFLDSGATHHITSDITALSPCTPYTGGDNLHVGNGNALPICHIGNCDLSIGGVTYKLIDVLHVPTITKNLISISRFTLDNDVLMEFHPSFCIIKDCHTMAPVLQAPLINGLYHFSSSPRVFLGERASADLWHARLGHPSSSTTRLIINTHQLPLSSSTSFVFSKIVASL